MIFDPIYWLVIGAGMLLSLWAQARVKGAFKKYSRIGTSSRLTGAQIAQKILERNGIHDVTVESVRGSLSDHYDPRSKTLRLSEPVYGSSSMAAFGIAAHEVGHAIQHSRGYAPLGFRSRWVPVASLGSKLSMFVIIGAFFLGGVGTPMGYTVSMVGILLFSTTTVFTLITLPVEFDASKRALVALDDGGFVNEVELAGAKKVLDAAAMTYVAAFVTSLLTLLYWASRLGIFGGRR
ncbi:MAG: zinc metallopeptidase [Acidobacteriota bacterium]|nr:zinc metallopeptidase [Acidobacteriota bacterium]MDH3784179.1 zinc metallopeptidase [Acidobacteriota bacterium]